MPLSKLDKFYRSVLLSKYFIKGWGDAKNLKRLLQFRKVVADRETCFKLVPSNYPVTITKDSKTSYLHILEGYFMSPFEIYMPGLLPEEAKKANFQMILPKKWTSDHYKPICLHMAGTGDHYFWRRRHIMAKPLLKEAGIGSIILENPFYGTRKPNNQVRSILHNVSDIFVMGGCLILEALVLFHWCVREGLGPLGVTGMSMGGHMASLAATNWPHPIVLVPCLSWSTASPVFTEGVMSNAINWALLENQYKEDKVYSGEIQKMVRVIGVDAFHAGQQFAKNFPHSMDDLTKISYGGGSLLHNNTKYPIKIGNRIVAHSFSNEGIKDIEQIELQKHETLNFMRGIMDECTHLRNFSVPVDTSLIISVCARDDGYVPREGVTHLVDIWPGATVKYLDAGHVSAFLLYQKVFRSAIVECFDRYKKKYMTD